MPDLLNKQAIINLLIDSPLREPIKINLIDIVNNTNEPDLPKVYSTITKELEIFQKATERRMKLAEETIAKLGGNGAPSAPATQDFSEPAQNTNPLPDLPPLPTTPSPSPVSIPQTDSTPAQLPDSGLSVPPLDLPPMPATPMPLTPDTATAVEESPAPMPPVQNFQPLGAAPMSSTSDEDALAEIQKELDSLKTAAAADLSADKASVTAAAAPAPANPPAAPQV